MATTSSLAAADLRRVLALTDALLDVRDGAGLAGVVLGGVAGLVGSDTATLTHLDLRTGHEVVVPWPVGRRLAAGFDAYPALGHTHPLRSPAARAAADPRRAHPVRTGDVMSAREWRRMPLQREAMPDVTDQMALPLRRRGHALHAVTLTRTAGRFTDRQRDLLGHAAAHVRAAVTRSAAAAGDALALQLSPHPEWVPLHRAPGLAAGAPPAGARPALPSLSDREREVLALVADGLTDAQVARRLGIRPATVSRHLHRVYARHGVANRAAAVRLLTAGA